MKVEVDVTEETIKQGDKGEALLLSLWEYRRIMRGIQRLRRKEIKSVRNWKSEKEEVEEVELSVFRSVRNNRLRKKGKRT